MRCIKYVFVPTQYCCSCTGLLIWHRWRRLIKTSSRFAVARWCVIVCSSSSSIVWGFEEGFNRDRVLERNCRCVGIAMTSGRFYVGQTYMLYMQCDRGECERRMQIWVQSHVSCQTHKKTCEAKLADAKINAYVGLHFHSWNSEHEHISR